MQPQQPAITQQVAQQHVRQDPRVDVAASDRHANAPVAEMLGIGQQRGDAGGTGAFRHDLGAFHQQADRLLDRVFRHHQHFDAQIRG